MAGQPAVNGSSHPVVAINIGALTANTTTVYCSRGCQQNAYRWRLQASQITPSGSTTQATVTRGLEPIENTKVFRTKDGHARPTIPLPAGYVFSNWEPCSPRSPILDDLSIPAFLRR